MGSALSLSEPFVDSKGVEGINRLIQTSIDCVNQTYPHRNEEILSLNGFSASLSEPFVDSNGVEGLNRLS